MQHFFLTILIFVVVVVILVVVDDAASVVVIVFFITFFSRLIPWLKCYFRYSDIASHPSDREAHKKVITFSRKVKNIHIIYSIDRKLLGERQWMQSNIWKEVFLEYIWMVSGKKKKMLENKFTVMKKIEFLPRWTERLFFPG